jgi:hypothetical protein
MSLASIRMRPFLAPGLLAAAAGAVAPCRRDTGLRATREADRLMVCAGRERCEAPDAVIGGG